MLNGADPATVWEVINFGISSSSTGQELVLYSEVVSRYHPDIVDDLWKDVLTRAGVSAFELRRDHPERRLDALCRESGVTLVTMADEFRRAAPGASSENPAEWLFCSGKYHLNDAGNLLAAQVLHRFLVPLDRE